MNILIADDSPVSRMLIQNILIEHKDADDFKFFNAENGQVALDILAYNEIDICFIDWHMPVMDGEDGQEEMEMMENIAILASGKDHFIRIH